MKIAFIELNTFHEECIYSQIKFLKDAGHHIFLFIHPELELQIKAYQHLTNDIYLYNFDSSTFFLKRILKFWQLYQVLLKGGFDKIIYNTASSKKEIIGLNLLIKQNRINSYGTIHNLKKINHSFSQKLISRNIKKYLVINDHLLNSTTFKDKYVKLESYYPIFFPYQNISIINKSDNEIWICIPGGLDFNRRDYKFVLNTVANLKINKLKFIILGRVDKTNKQVQRFFSDLKAKSIENKFIFFETFVDNTTFHSYLKASDFIFTPIITSNENYLTYKITGAYNLAFAYKIPLISHIKFKSIDDLDENGYFYHNQKELELLLHQIDNNSLTLKDTYSNNKWNYEYQQEKYLNFISN